MNSDIPTRSSLPYLLHLFVRWISCVLLTLVQLVHVLCAGLGYEGKTMQPPSPSSPLSRAAGDDAVQSKSKRPRAAQACERCRVKKYKCNESYPCAHCESMY